MAEDSDKQKLQCNNLEVFHIVSNNASHISPGKDRKTNRKISGKPIKERWLLTRKTWRYIADAGRRLIPDNSYNRYEDISKIEQYFDEICSRESRFLLWRKTSCPESSAFCTIRRRYKTGNGHYMKTISAEGIDDSRITNSNITISCRPTISDKLNLDKIKKEWLLSTNELEKEKSSNLLFSLPHKRKNLLDDVEIKALADMLQKYLYVQCDDNGIRKLIPLMIITGSNNDHSKTCITTKSILKDKSIGNGFDKELTVTSNFDYEKFTEKLEQHLNQIVADGRKEEISREFTESSKTKNSVIIRNNSTDGCISATVPKVRIPYQSDYIHKSLLDTLSRYYSKSSNRQHVISDILTDRKLLEKLYFDLRCTRAFKRLHATDAYILPTTRWWKQQPATTTLKINKEFSNNSENRYFSNEKKNLRSLPSIIVIQSPSTECRFIDSCIQTDSISREILDNFLLQKEKEQLYFSSSTKELHKSGRRRSGIDINDISPSVSDTIKRYLRMARKKSIETDKVDRFKRVNYDKNSHTIKIKGERPSDNVGNNKGCQTEDNWILSYREMNTLEPGESLSELEITARLNSRNANSRSSIVVGIANEIIQSTSKYHQSFLSHLLHGSYNTCKEKPHSAPGSPALTSSSTPLGSNTMQKSKSSSSVVYHSSKLVAKKIWKSRNKNSSRAINLISVWTPQGKYTWASTNGQQVTLQDTPLRSLSNIEKKVLSRVAITKLQALNLGVHIRIPNESFSMDSVTTKPRRRPYLLKRKVLTTGFFDNKIKDDKDKESSRGLVFGISLLQCLKNDKLTRLDLEEPDDVRYLNRSSRYGSRTSFTSLTESTIETKNDEGGSCESLLSKDGVLTISNSDVLELNDSGSSDKWESVPCIVKQCIKHLEVKGLNTLGIFRVSPSKKRVRQLREDWDCGRETKIGPDQCPHDVAALLKEYFRDLPDPLLCKDLYQAFLHTQKIRNRRLQQEALQHLIQLLPTTNHETLYVLLNFLSELAANSEDRKGEDGERLLGNKMDATNLATVFAPNILHCVKPGQAHSELSFERAEERLDVINIVRALLELVDTLFIVPAALLDELYLHMMDSYPTELNFALSRRFDE